jgi:hypothetical protein
MADALVYAVERKVGRLVEARLFGAPRSPAQVREFTEALRRTFLSVGGPCVVCADWRGATLLAPEIADALVDLLRQGNPHVERSGVLLASQGAMLTLQAERVIREAANPARRAFREAGAMRSWLSAVLDAAETQRLDEFLLD